MFKKIEIWILYLTFIFVFISYIIFGWMVRRETSEEFTGYAPKKIPIISKISKVAYFLSSIPELSYNIFSKGVDQIDYNNRFDDKIIGFSGIPNKFESYLLLPKYNIKLKEYVVNLIDLTTFKILHEWNPNLDSYFQSLEQKDNDNLWEHLSRDYNNRRFEICHPLFNSDGSIIFNGQAYTPLIKIDKNSNVLWIKSDNEYHHSINSDIDNNLWVCTRYNPAKIDNKYTGKHFKKRVTYHDDGIRKITPNGDILFDKSISEIFIENNMEYLLFATNPFFNNNPIHLNDIQPVPSDTKYWKKGDVFLSLRNQSMILLYRPETNQIIWKSAGKFFYQHDVDIIDNHRISIFNNNTKYFWDGYKVDGENEILIYDFLTAKYESYQKQNFINDNIKTVSAGIHEILENGDLYIEESNYGRLLYYDKTGRLQWIFLNQSADGFEYSVSWSRILHKKNDLLKVRKFLDSKKET